MLAQVLPRVAYCASLVAYLGSGESTLSVSCIMCSGPRCKKISARLYLVCDIFLYRCVALEDGQQQTRPSGVMNLTVQKQMLEILLTAVFEADVQVKLDTLF